MLMSNFKKSNILLKKYMFTVPATPSHYTLTSYCSLFLLILPSSSMFGTSSKSLRSNWKNFEYCSHKKKNQHLDTLEKASSSSLSIALSFIQTLFISSQASKRDGHGSLLIPSLVNWLHPGVIPDLILVYSLEVDSRVGRSPCIKAPELIIFSD